VANDQLRKGEAFKDTVFGLGGVKGWGEGRPGGRKQSVPPTPRKGIMKDTEVARGRVWFA